MRKQLLLFLVAVTALGCGKDRYEIVAVPPTVRDGITDFRFCHAYRLDTQTGEVLCIKDRGMYSVRKVN